MGYSKSTVNMVLTNDYRDGLDTEHLQSHCHVHRKVSGLFVCSEACNG